MKIRTGYLKWQNGLFYLSRKEFLAGGSYGGKMLLSEKIQYASNLGFIPTLLSIISVCLEIFPLRII